MSANPFDLPRGVRAAALIREANDKAVALWRDGRSLAGIQMELAAFPGVRCSIRRIWARLKQRRKRDRSIPPGLYRPEDFSAGVELADQRADFTDAWQATRAAQLIALQIESEAGHGE